MGQGPDLAGHHGKSGRRALDKSFSVSLPSSISQLRRVPPTTAAKALAQLLKMEKKKRREPYSQRGRSQLGMPR